MIAASAAGSVGFPRRGSRTVAASAAETCGPDAIATNCSADILGLGAAARETNVTKPRTPTAANAKAHGGDAAGQRLRIVIDQA